MPPSEVSLYFEFISLAVSAIAVITVSRSTRRLAGISLLRHQVAGPRLDRAERAALDARDLHEAGDRVAGHAEMMLERGAGAVGGDLVGLAHRRRDRRRAHRRGHADLGLAAAFGSRQRGVVLA